MPSAINHGATRRPVGERFYYISEDDEESSKPEPVTLGKRTRRAPPRSLSTLTAPVAKKPRLETAPARPTQLRKISATPDPLSEEHSDSESEIVGYMGKGKRWPMGRNAYHCHQCRNKTAILSATCINRRCGHKLFCARCLTLRYEDLPRHIRIPTKKNIRIPSCPRCEGFCSCSHCRAPRPDGKDGTQAVPSKGRFSSYPAETSVSAPLPRLISAASWAAFPGSSTAGSSTPPVIEGIKRVVVRPIYVQFSQRPAEEEQEQDELAADLSGSEPQVEPPSVRRKRGRPPKVIEEMEKEAVEKEVPTASADDVPPPVPVKRGPGRPRKVVPPVEEKVIVKQEDEEENVLGKDEAAESSADEQSAPQPVKRGRGRPRKVVANPNDSTTSPVKRKRGRPRKVQPVVQTADTESEGAEAVNRTSAIGEKGNDGEKGQDGGDVSVAPQPAATQQDDNTMDSISGDEGHSASTPAALARTRSQTRQAGSVKMDVDEPKNDEEKGKQNGSVSAPMMIRRRGKAKVSVSAFGRACCHQCRRRAFDYIVCTNEECSKRIYCGKCLTTRYTKLPDSIPIPTAGILSSPLCPRCAGWCSCDACTRGRGEVYVAPKRNASQSHNEDEDEDDADEE